MKSKRKKNPSLKIKSDKNVKKIQQRYAAGVEKGKEKALKDLDKLFEDLGSYYGKRGKPLKSKLRSNKAKAAYNEILKQIEALGSAPKRAAKAKEVQVEEATQQLSDYFGMTGEHAKAAAEIFVNNTMPAVIKAYNPSDIVLTLADAGFNSETILDILKYIDREIEFSTPDEMKKFRSEDDIYMFVSHIASIYELDNTIPVEDIIKLSEQMLMYDLNDYDSVIEQYHNDERNIWDEEDEE